MLNLTEDLSKTVMKLNPFYIVQGLGLAVSSLERGKGAKENLDTPNRLMVNVNTPIHTE